MPLYKLYFYCCFHIIVKEKELTTDTRVTQVTESCELTFTVGFFCIYFNKLSCYNVRRKIVATNDHGCMRSKTITCKRAMALHNSRAFFISDDY